MGLKGTEFMATRVRNAEDVAALFEADLAANHEQAMPQPYMPTSRSSGHKHYFRSDHGWRNPSVRIPGVPEGNLTEKQYGALRRVYEKKYSEAERLRHEQVREANGGEWYIQFQHIPNRFESYFETDSDILADYLRDEIAAGRITFAYEDARVDASDSLAHMPVHRAAAALRVQKARGEAAA